MRLMELVAIMNGGERRTVGVNPRHVKHVEPAQGTPEDHAVVVVGERTFVVEQSPREVMDIIEGTEAESDGC